MFVDAETALVNKLNCELPLPSVIANSCTIPCCLPHFGDLIVWQTCRWISASFLCCCTMGMEQAAECRQVWSCCNQQTYFAVNWWHTCWTVYGHQRVGWFVL